MGDCGCHVQIFTAGLFEEYVQQNYEREKKKHFRGKSVNQNLPKEQFLVSEIFQDCAMEE